MVMHARKPQRMNDGYFEKHQSHSYQSSKYSSKRGDYERNDRVSSYRDRDISPGSGISLNNGNSYRSQSPELDSPSSRGHGGSSSHDMRDRSEHRGGSDRYSYIQKMRDRERDVYKKDKYSDKRDRRSDRESESHRTNHDRGDRRGGLSSSSKYCSANDKRSGSDERERDRERDRDRDLRDIRDKREHRGGSDERKRERERDLRESERRRGGGGSGGGSSAGGGGSEDKRSTDRGERIARYGDWSEHVSSSGKMYYYNCKTEVSQWEKPKEWIERERNIARDQHREKDYREKERDRERDDRFSRSTYSKHSSSRGNTRVRWNYDNDGRPPSHRRRIDGRICENVDMDISPGDSTPTSEASFTISGTSASNNNSTNANNQHSSEQSTATTTVGLPNALPRLASHPTTSALQSNATNCSSASPVGATSANVCQLPPNMLPSTAANANSNHRKLDSVQMIQNQTQLPAGSPNAALTSNQADHHVNSNAPGPPKVGSKEQMNPAHSSIEATNHTIRENALNSPLYNLTHPHGMSPLNYTRSPLTTQNSSGGVGVGVGVVSHANNSTNYSSTKTGDSNLAYSTNAPSTSAAAAAAAAAFAASQHQQTQQQQQLQHQVSNSSNSNLPASSSNITSLNTSTGSSSGGALAGEGPPTPTQELDTSATSSIDQQQQRKEGTSSASLSNLQSCVSSSVQAARLQGPEISPKLAKYFRSDLIQHVTNWQADSMESQFQKLSEEAHLSGDLQCTKVSTELKCARSLVRITEITATLQEQRIMYLRQQIRRLDESKTQNSFMSEDT